MDDAKKKHGNLKISKSTYLLKAGIDNMATDLYTAERLAY